MNRASTILALIWGAFVLNSSAQGLFARKEKSGKESTGTTTFAPVPPEHELASIWNDPDFRRRLIGSYGFSSDLEPRMTPEEQAVYRDKVVPLLKGDLKKAIAALESLAKPGASALFDFTLGNVFFQSEDLTNAVKRFEIAIQKFPDYMRAQKNLGFAMMRDAKYKDAIKPLTRAIALGGGDGKVFGLLGFALMNQGRYISADGAYRQALVFEPENTDFKLGLVKCAIASANYDYALSILDELIQQFPERDNLWTLQANLFIQKENPAKAALALEMLRRLGRATPPNLFLLGDLYMAQEARDLALGTYLEAVSRDDGKNRAKSLRAADILVSRGAWDEARTLIGKVRESPATDLSDEEQMKLLKLESRVALGTGRGEEGIRILEEIIQRNPLDGEALLLAGDFYAKNDQREKAEFRYQTAANLEDYRADAWLKQAQLLVQVRKYNEALEFLKRAQKLKPRENVQRYLEKVEQVARTARS